MGWVNIQTNTWYLPVVVECLMCLSSSVDWIPCDLNLTHEFLSWYTDFLPLSNMTHEGDLHSASKSMLRLTWDQTLFQMALSENGGVIYCHVKHGQNIWPKVYFPIFIPNASVNSSGAHPPPGQPRGICSNVSPGGGALAILSQPGGWALAYPEKTG